jgi:hypothetical protein
MRLENHIVKKILNNSAGFTVEVIEAINPKGVDPDALDKYDDIIHAIDNKGNRNYYITKSVIERLNLLDTKKCMDAEGWKLFSGLPDFKKTYILPDPEPSYAKYGGSGYVRIVKSGKYLHFMHISSKFLPPAERTRTMDSTMYVVLLYIDLEKGEMCGHFQSEDGKSLAPFLYSLMCFVELCDNEVVIVEPKAKFGTRKQGKIINTLPFPVTIITNTWNITKVLKGTIWVCGHAQIYWTGPGRTVPKLLYKEPFTKEGYTRKSGKELSNIKNNVPGNDPVFL